MREQILQSLKELEQVENIHVLYAAESGSRAWGFASEDSDYDVRFLYVRPTSYYLRLEKKADFLNPPIRGELDINGWDIDKALRLLYTSNPTLFEWSNSPIVYRTSLYFEELQRIINQYFKAKAGLYHYLNTAAGNYREYLKGERVKAKKYFYVLRPILACKWILRENCPPPMLFGTLVHELLEPELQVSVEKLLDIKKNSPEIGEINRIEVLNEYIESNLLSLKQAVEEMPADKSQEWERLNGLFLLALRQ